MIFDDTWQCLGRKNDGVVATKGNEQKGCPTLLEGELEDPKTKCTIKVSISCAFSNKTTIAFTSLWGGIFCWLQRTVKICTRAFRHHPFVQGGFCGYRIKRISLSFKSIDLNPVLTLPVSTFESDDVVALSFAWFSTKHQQLWMTNFDRLPCQLNLCPLCTVALLEGTVKLLSNVILQPEGAAPNPEVVRCLHVQRFDLWLYSVKPVQKTEGPAPWKMEYCGHRSDACRTEEKKSIFLTAR